jgi:hypothetical protein
MVRTVVITAGDISLKKWLFHSIPMLQFPPVCSRVGLGEHLSDRLRGSKRAQLSPKV